jgi:hypothetical protein
MLLTEFPGVGHAWPNPHRKEACMVIRAARSHEPAGPLTSEQVETFHINNYLVVPGLFDLAEMAEITAWADEVQHWPETPGEHMMYFESSRDDEQRRLLNRVENVLPFHAGFNTLANGPKMRGACAQLFGAPAVLFKDKINFKLPGGDGFEPHQDIQAGWERYARLHITAHIAIDPCTTENGCLEMAAGFHDRVLLGTEWQPLTDEDLEGIDFVQVPARPGDAVFFDSYIPHKSAPNNSAGSRRVLYYTYNRAYEGDSLAQYYADKRASYPPDIERDPKKKYAYKV